MLVLGSISTAITVHSRPKGRLISMADAVIEDVCQNGPEGTVGYVHVHVYEVQTFNEHNSTKLRRKIEGQTFYFGKAEKSQRQAKKLAKDWAADRQAA